MSSIQKSPNVSRQLFATESPSKDDFKPKNLFGSEDTTDKTNSRPDKTNSRSDKTNSRPEKTNFRSEKTNFRPGDIYIKKWSEFFNEGLLESIPSIILPTSKITIPIKIVNELKVLRENVHEWGGDFYFDNNTITSYTKQEGDEHYLDMNIDPEKRLMYHTHPSSRDRYVSPPSEIDIATLFNNSVNANKCIPHLVFSKEGIYLIYCHSQIINKNYQNERLRNDASRKSVIDFHLQDYIQELRMLLGYIRYDGGPRKEIEAKIDINRFIEIINKMGFILKFYPYPTSDLELELPDNSQILIGGSDKKYKVFY